MEDYTIFKSWFKASSEECLENYKLIQPKNKAFFWKIWKKQVQNEMKFYDPTHRFNSEFLLGIDYIPKDLNYIYRPCVNIENTIEGWELHNEYFLKSINKNTINLNKKYIKNKEEFALRRYYNSFVKNVRIFYNINKPNVNIHKNNFNVNFEFIDYDNYNINQILYENNSDTDLIIIILDKIKENITLDNFIPSVPIYYNENVLILTPILLQQINGCNPENIKLSFYSRIADYLGMILVKDDNFKINFNYESEFIENGMSNFDKGIFTDGRIKRLIPEFTKHIPEYGHGWTVNDTPFTIAGVVNTLKPKVVVELGSWVGLSARTISNYNDQFTLYAIDNFENYGRYNKIIHEDLHPCYKMLFNHSRYETFCANLSARKNKEKVSRFFFDKQDENPNKNVILMRMLFYEGLEILYKNNITPDLIFVHSPPTNKMDYTNLINFIREKFPKTTIIGTGLVYSFIKKATEDFDNKNINILNDSYYWIDKKFHKQINSSIKNYREELGLNEFEESIQDQFELLILRNFKILKTPYTKISISQSGYSIHEYFRRKQLIEKEILLTIEDIINDGFELLSWKYPINPGSYTPFDYFNNQITFE